MVQVTRLVCIARKAGMEILRNYSDFIKNKGGLQIVEEAETASHNVIIEKLDHFYKDIPVISRISKNPSLKNKDVYFLVDPLCGRDAFLKSSPMLEVGAREYFI